MSSNRKPDFAPQFLASLAKSANVRSACKAAQVGRQTAYDRRHDDEAFALAWDAAIEDAVDALEQEARRRATRKRKPSDTLLIFLLKAHRPEKYREYHDHTLRGKVEVQIVSEMSDDELKRIIQRGEAAHGTNGDA